MPRPASVLVCVLVLLVVGACQRESERAAPGDARPAIVLLSLDTLRADHLSSYGYARPTSPRLDAFAAEAIRFSAAHAQATGTVPSHLSMLASLHPPHFRITRADGRNDTQPKTRLKLPDAVTTLAEVLRDAGYATAAFTDGGTMSARYGQGQGFDLYETNRNRGLQTTLEKLADFLSRRDAQPGEAERPLFLFLHTFDVHGPYRAAGPFARAFSSRSYNEVRRAFGFEPLPAKLERNKDRLTAADLDEVRALYDNGIAWADDTVAALFELLAAHELYEGALIVVLSDHGEEFFDHGGFNHGPTIYQEQVHVPLLIRLPRARRAGRVIDAPVALVDVAPTLLDLAGVAAPPSFQGVSLRDAIEGTAAPAERAVYFESPRASVGPHGLRKGRWKVIRNERDDRVELYDLVADPLERDDVSQREVERTRRLASELARWVDEMERTGRREGWFAVPQAEALSSEEQATLRALGYVE